MNPWYGRVYFCMGSLWKAPIKGTLKADLPPKSAVPNTKIRHIVHVSYFGTCHSHFGHPFCGNLRYFLSLPLMICLNEAPTTWVIYLRILFPILSSPFPVVNFPSPSSIVTSPSPDHPTDPALGSFSLQFANRLIV